MIGYGYEENENIFDYIPITFFVQIESGNPKHYISVMHPFLDVFKAIEDSKPSMYKYKERL